ncbi:hypothetical protein AALB_0812 [Agarivorans albus MKT 106]|uniref:Uncharacterized protein n=1 Tax=Agarivorans albus MKT 106 TaxID=1331007 RepID=R9PHC4_AGAAL|nr:hypothetical protein AALB_0812 [Agarivorans albus MKT 106]
MPLLVPCCLIRVSYCAYTVQQSMRSKTHLVDFYSHEHGNGNVYTQKQENTVFSF